MIKQCRECLGEGQITTETGVADWTHGGYLLEKITECFACGGSGETDWDDWADEDAVWWEEPE